MWTLEYVFIVLSLVVLGLNFFRENLPKVVVGLANLGMAVFALYLAYLHFFVGHVS